MNVKSTFLNGVLEEEVYIEQLPDYVKEGKKNKMLKLKKDDVRAEVSTINMEYPN
jgi:hypothetical protein